MRLFLRFHGTFMAGIALATIGCAEREPSRQDVVAAREAYEVERQETAEAAREADEAVRQELDEEREAGEELQATEQKFQDARARDVYVSDVERQLAEAQERIDQLEENAARADGEPEEDLDARIDLLHSQHDRAEEALSELKSAELENWRGHQDKVRLALHDLSSNLSGVR